jgi:Ca-activated chloride channel family protein
MSRLTRKHLMGRSIWVENNTRSTRCRRYLRTLGIGFLIIVVALVATFLVIKKAGASADTETERSTEIRMGDVSRGSLLFKTSKPGVFHAAPMLNTSVDMRVSGMIVRAVVSQEFKNQTDEWMEGIYVFPLPENAAVDHLRMRIGERIIEGKIKERTEAKKIYRKAKAEGKKASLIEQERPNMFTNSVANIGPKESIVVEIEYQQTLRYDQGHFRLRFPLAITPRYIPGQPIKREETVLQFAGTGWAADTNQVPDASRVTPPVYVGEGAVNPVAMHIELDAGFPLKILKSSYHAITNTHHGQGKKTITLANGPVPADHDFELVWTPEVSHAPRAALFTETKQDDLYHFMMVLPPDAQGKAKQPLAREVIYIIDTSGSMSGVSIVQAKRALLMALDRLRPQDRFNVIQFNSYTDQLFPAAVPASQSYLQRARQYVNGLTANGGTNMMSALTAALNHADPGNYIGQIIFLTDGSVGNETQLFDLISARLGDRRLFTVGIGSAPNSYFMKKAAQFGRGTFTYISDVSEVQTKMSTLFSKLETPVMSNLQLEFDDDTDIEMWPKRLPDLYAGEPVVFSIKAGSHTQQLSLYGQRGQEQWRVTVPLLGGQTNNGVGAVWARSKIEALMDSLHEGAKKEEVRDNVIRVALQHHLVSKYTSLVAVDVTPSRPQHEALKTKNVPNNLPKGQQYEKIFGQLANTATPAQLHLMIGIMCLVLLAMIWISSRGLRRGAIG